jgi:hypothetical protein
VISNPASLEEYVLAPVDVKFEVEAARFALGTIPVTFLECDTGGQPATLENLFHTLWRQKVDSLAYYDFLWMIEHSALLKGETWWLWMEDESKAVKRISGSEIKVRFKELGKSPYWPYFLLAKAPGATPTRHCLLWGLASH